MKVKTPHQTVGPFGKHHKHLGHFTHPNVVNRGHNDGPRIIREDDIPVRTMVEDTAQRYPGAVSDEGESFAPRGGSKSTRIPYQSGGDEGASALRRAMKARQKVSGRDDI